MKRYLAALGAAAVAGSAVIGSAAALGVTGGVVQTGSTTDLTCQDSPVRVLQRWDTDVNEAAPESIGPQIQGVEEDCVGDNVVVTVFGDGETRLSQFVTEIANAGTINGTWEDAGVQLADIESMTVTIIS